MKEEKNFIFPMNYNQKENFLGFIDYRALSIIAVIAFVIFQMLHFINWGIKIKVCVFIIFTGMPAILLIIGINGEKMPDFIRYMIKFFIKDNVYVYRKSIKSTVIIKEKK